MQGAREWRHPFFLPSPVKRCGNIVPIRIFGGAVNRNYARRRLREFFRRNKILFPDRTDVLIRMYSKPVDWNQFLSHLQDLLLQVYKQVQPADKKQNSSIRNETSTGSGN